MLKKTSWFNRSILSHGQDGVAVGIPASVRDDRDLKAGADGDTVDLEYNREDDTLTIHFHTE